MRFTLVEYMEIKITKKIDNPFFKRKDLRIDIIHKGAPTPRTDDLKKELGKMYKVDDSQVSVEYILTKRGIGESIAKVRILNEKPVIVEKPEEKKKEEEKKGEQVGKEEKEGGETETQTSEA